MNSSNGSHTSLPSVQIHEAFLERAASARGETPPGHALGAFLTLRLVDLFAAGAAEMHPDAVEYQVTATRAFLLNLQPRSPEVGHLLEIARVSEVAHQSYNPRLLWPPLLALAYSLEQGLRLEEAFDVLETALRLSDERDAEEEVAALYQKGRVLRKLSRYHESTASYRASGEVAARLGDKHSELLSQIGCAIVLEKLGNLPQAERGFRSVIDAATINHDQDAEARARHDLANTLMLMERPTEAVTQAFRAYQLYSTPGQRVRALADLGMGFKMLGNYVAARDAFELAIGTEPPREVRVNVSLELLEVAALTQNRLDFERWRRDLAVLGELPPDAQVDFEVKLGSGLASFGKLTRGRMHLQRAIQLAETHDLNAYLFQAEAALRELDRPEAVDVLCPDPTGAQPEGADARYVAEQLRALRGADDYSQSEWVP